MPAFQVLYRAKTLEDLIANKASLSSLKKILQRDNPPNAFLITGPAGTGKTTLGRIIKDMLKCSRSDFTELNASDDRGIDAVRTLADGMRTMPLSGKTKVILLDEAHMLTKPAQEALLKSLEEPPKYVHWIICTTNPETLKPTLKRRCHQYTMQRVMDEDMKQLLKNIILKEKKKTANYPGPVIHKLINIAEGSPGQAMKLLDQIIDLTDPKEMMSVLDNVSFSDESGDIADICKILVDDRMKDEPTRWKKLAPLLKNLDIDPESGRRVVLSWMTTTLLSRESARIAYVMDNFKDNFFDNGKAGFVLACYKSCIELE